MCSLIRSCALSALFAAIFAECLVTAMSALIAAHAAIPPNAVPSNWMRNVSSMILFFLERRARLAELTVLRAPDGYRCSVFRCFFAFFVIFLMSFHRTNKTIRFVLQVSFPDCPDLKPIL